MRQSGRCQQLVALRQLVELAKGARHSPAPIRSAAIHVGKEHAARSSSGDSASRRHSSSPARARQSSADCRSRHETPAWLRPRPCRRHRSRLRVRLVVSPSLSPMPNSFDASFPLAPATICALRCRHKRHRAAPACRAPRRKPPAISPFTPLFGSFAIAHGACARATTPAATASNMRRAIATSSDSIAPPLPRFSPVPSAKPALAKE